MRDQELVNALREHAEWAEGNQWETPITLGDDLAEAADRIANQSTHVAALQQEIEKLRGQVPRWIPVKERLPELQSWGRINIGAGHSTERIRLSATQSVLLCVPWQSEMEDSRTDGDDYPLDAAADRPGGGKCLRCAP